MWTLGKLGEENKLVEVEEDNPGPSAPAWPPCALRLRETKPVGAAGRGGAGTLQRKRLSSGLATGDYCRWQKRKYETPDPLGKATSQSTIQSQC